MSYEVFARKYRPQTFDDVVGQEHITRTLKNAITQSRLAHAYLFVGPRGTGKTSTARILAKALNCIHAPTVDPCGVCDLCREIAAGNSLNVLEFDAASNTQVDKIRDLIIDNVKYAPIRGQYKIYIVDEVHMLSNSSFNALLKTLEEPPPHVKFVFATTDVQKVPTTIVSRCQRFDLRRIPAPLIAAHLQKIAGLEKITLAPPAAEAIARGAEGGLRDAESMLDQLVAFCGETIALDDVLSVFGFNAPETVARLAGHVLARRTSEALALLDAQSEAGKDLLRLLGELIAHLRDLLVFQVDPAGARAEATEVQKAAFAEQAPLAGTDRVLELIDGFGEAENRMKWAPNKKLHFEIALIKAIQMLGQSTLTDVIDALAAIREGSPDALPRPKLAPALAARPAPSEPTPAPLAAGTKFSELKKSVAEAKPASHPAPAPSAPASKTPAPPEPAVAPPAAATVVSETPAPPPPAAATPAPAPAPAPIALAPLDPAALWRDLIREVSSHRPLISPWVQVGQPLGADGPTLRVGFAPDQKMSIDSLGKAATRKYLEDILAKLAGQPVKLKLEVDASIAPLPPPSPASGGATARDATNGTKPASMMGANGASPSVDSAAADDPANLFRNDPLIQKALNLFEGEIRSVEGP